MDDAWAYAIPCNPGEEYEYLVFANFLDADDEWNCRCADLEEGKEEPEIIPLYPRSRMKTRCFECRGKSPTLICKDCGEPLCSDCREEHEPCIFEDGKEIFELVNYHNEIFCLECFQKTGRDLNDEDVEILRLDKDVLKVVPKCSVCLKKFPQYLGES